MPELLNLNPGLVPNDRDGKSCFLACSQMLLRTQHGVAVPSFDQLSRIIHRKPGQYSWEYAMLTYFASVGFSVRCITTFDLKRLCDEGNSYMYEYFGAEAAEDQIRNSDMDQVRKDMREFLEAPGVDVISRIPEQSDVKSLLAEGFYLIPYVNQRILQADPGYVAHTVFVYGFSSRGVRLHNPGPPATEATEIAWDLFVKAWSSPKDESRILFAARPLDCTG
jgi:hypothetical protein